MGRRLAALLALTACGEVELPAYLAALTEIAPDRGDEAVDLTVGYYEAELDVELPHVAVHWVAEPIQDGGWYAVIGLERACDDIWVTYSAPISSGALTRVVGLCAQSVVPDLDVDALAAAANVVLRAAGL